MLEMRSYTYSTTKTMARKSLEPGQLRAFVFLDTTASSASVCRRRWCDVADARDRAKS